MQWDVSNTRPRVFSAENLSNRKITALTADFLRLFPGSVAPICRSASRWGNMGQAHAQAWAKPSPTAAPEKASFAFALHHLGWPFRSLLVAGAAPHGLAPM